jgi:hypothetical protein
VSDVWTYTESKNVAGKSGIAYLPRPSAETSLADRLDGVRSRIEQRFLDGGGTLLSVLDVLNRLISALDEFSKLLDDEAARSSLEQLGSTVNDVSALPEFEQERQLRIATVAKCEQALGTHVADMQETLRYLRTFATTAKITGSRIPDFSTFADEIIERVQQGAKHINFLSDTISTLDGILVRASSSGQQTLNDYRQSVPALVGRLNGNVAEFVERRGELSKLAVEVNARTRKVQTKIGITLSAMQIGDITRQRIEHCQQAIAIVDDYLASASGRVLDDEQQEALRGAVHNLVHAQLSQLTSDFDRECATVVTTLLSFNADIEALLLLHERMNRQDGTTAASAMRLVGADLASVHGIVCDIDKAADEANKLSEDTIQTIHVLLDEVATIKQVRTDIHYMALNTNLRCGKLGEEGRAINVVTSELRLFSANLDDSAQRVIEELQGLEADTRKLGESAANGASEVSLGDRLNDALSSIRGIADRMEDQIETLRACGQDVGTKVLASLSTLDFKSGLGDVLTDCTREAGLLAAPAHADLTDIDEAMADIGPTIAKIYTMAAERAVHAQVFDANINGNFVDVSATEDLDLDEALF